MPLSQRIGYVLKMYPRFSETFVVTELLAMQRGGVDFDVFSLRFPNDGRFHESLAEMRAPVHYLRSQPSRAVDLWEQLAAARTTLPGFDAVLPALLEVEVGDAGQALELAQMVVQRDISHLHAHFASVATTVARLAALLAGVTYSFTAHAKDIFHRDVDPLDLRRKIAEAKAVVAISEYNAEYLTEAYPDLSEVIHRVYNGLDLRHFHYASPIDRPWRIAAVGRLVEKKGFSYLLQAAAVLRQRGLQFEIDIVGTGELATALAEERDRLGLAGVVTLHGALPQSQVRQIVGSAAALVAPCIVGEDGNRDGLPTVLLEAMALGTPSISTPVTGIVEALEHDRTGLLVPERDPAALAGAMETLLSQPATRVRLAVAARQLIEDRFDSHHQAASVAELFTRRMATAGIR